MDYCIYCHNSDYFNKEHVIPKSLGTFEPNNPTLRAEDRMVCRTCNSQIFSKLETEFKEDTREGLNAQMLNLTNNLSVRVRGVNVQLKCLSPFNGDFFNEIFPFIEVQGGVLVVVFKSQIKVRGFANKGGFQIFLFEQIRKLNPRTRKFKELKRRFANVKSGNIVIFAGANGPGDNHQSDKIVKLLKTLGVEYQEKRSKFVFIEDQKNPYEIIMDYRITANVCRIIAKVAFNYFAYCALQSGQSLVLFDTNFDRLKKFVLGDSSIDKGSIIEVSDDPITTREKESGRRIIGHTIVFFEEDGNIYSQVSFFGSKVYKVLIGRIPSILQQKSFGCGHIFNPFNKTIEILTQAIPPLLPDMKIDTSFGLFKRIPIA